MKIKEEILEMISEDWFVDKVNSYDSHDLKSIIVDAISLPIVIAKIKNNGD